MDRMPKAPASPVLVSAPVDGLGVPLNLEARAARLLDEGQAVVLLTVVEREGSAPRAAGTRALLTAAGLEGTVGGGLLEARAVEAANVCLKEGRSARVRCDLTGLGPDSDMICGGSMDLLCEYLTPAQAPLFRAADAALKAGLTGIWLLDVSRADAPVRDLYLDALPEGQRCVEIGALARQTLPQGGVAAAQIEISGPDIPVRAVPCGVVLPTAQRGQIEQRFAGNKAAAPVGQLPGAEALAAFEDLVEVEVVLDGDALMGE